MILFFYGPNTYASRKKLHELVGRYKKTSGSDFGLERFDAESAEAENIISAITSAPFLAQHRLVIIEDMLSNKAMSEAVLSALKRVPESSVVVFYERQPDERTKVFKELKKQAKTVKFEPLPLNQLVNWIRKTAQEFGGNIDSQAAQALIEQAGTEQWNLYHQLHKLVMFNSTISPDTINEMVEPVFEKTIFDLTEALGRGDTKQALEYYQGLRFNKAEPLYILSMIAWALRNLLIVKSAGGRVAGDIAKAAGMNPFVVSKAQAAARNLDLTMLKNAQSELVETDYKLKTSAGEPDVLMEQLIMNVATLVRA